MCMNSFLQFRCLIGSETCELELPDTGNSFLHLFLTFQLN